MGVYAPDGSLYVTLANGDPGASGAYAPDGSLRATPLTRIKLTEATTYYISTTGSDSTGKGTSALPWATLQFAFEYLAENIDSAGYLVTLQLADGTYDGFYLYDGNTPANMAIRILGNTGDKSAVVIQPGGTGDALVYMEGTAQLCTVYLNYLTLQYAATYPVICWYSNSLTLGADPVNGYGSGGGVHLTGAGPGNTRGLFEPGYRGRVEVYGTYTINISSGTTGYFMANAGQGYFYHFTATVTVTALTVTQKFILLQELSYGTWRSSSVSGTVTGTKYLVEHNSVLSEVTTVPGTVAGSTATGGQVI